MGGGVDVTIASTGVVRADKYGDILGHRGPGGLSYPCCVSRLRRLTVVHFFSGVAVRRGAHKNECVYIVYTVACHIFFALTAAGCVLPCGEQVGQGRRTRRISICRWPVGPAR